MISARELLPNILKTNTIILYKSPDFMLSLNNKVREVLENWAYFLTSNHTLQRVVYTHLDGVRALHVTTLPSPPYCLPSTKEKFYLKVKTMLLCICGWLNNGPQRCLCPT